MNLKSTLIVSAALLFISAPAWADSVKSQTPDLATSSRTFSRSDIKRLGGFKTQGGHLVQMSDDDAVPDGDADDSSTVSAPEPGSMALLVTGLLCVGVLTGVFAYRRNPLPAPK
jgi:hypothetical protein